MIPDPPTAPDGWLLLLAGGCLSLVVAQVIAEVWLSETK